MGRITRLEWDTEFFGVEIGRADLGGATPEVLREVDEEARDLGLECLYAAIDPSDTALVTVKRSPWILVEVGMVLRRDPAEPFPVPEVAGKARLGTPDDLEALQWYVHRLAPWSRYAMDTRFGVESASRLLEAWLERAADPASDRWALHVVEEEGTITSFLTLEYEPHPRIDLIGASTPGSGSTDALMAFTLEGEKGQDRILGGPIAARNVHALAYSERCGYRMSRARYNFHRWLDEDGGSRWAQV